MPGWGVEGCGWKAGTGESRGAGDRGGQIIKDVEKFIKDLGLYLGVKGKHPW